MDKLQKLLYVTGLAYILSDTYKTYALTNKQADEIGKLISEEFRVEDPNKITKEEADRIMDYLNLEIQHLVDELIPKEENNDNPLPVSE